MPATLSPLVQESPLKEYLIFRIDSRGAHRELANESALEGEAVRYADLIADTDAGEGIHYEVRRADGGGLLYTTGDRAILSKESSWRRTATW